MNEAETQNKTTLKFHGSILGAIFPFLLFISGVIFIALSGAPDEKGFWPILVGCIGFGLILSKDKKQYSESVIKGMSDPIVMIMITAWILASTIGILMTITGFVEALVWIAESLNLQGTGFIVATFVICCTVSLSTGSSFATILICSPLLYPSGGLLGANLPTLAGAILAGATFGDFFAPISDTTIASALSQKTEIGPTVKSRLKYILPAFVVAIIMFVISGSLGKESTINNLQVLNGNPEGIPMIIIPIIIIYLFLKGKHLLHGLMFGLLGGIVLGLALGLLEPNEIISLDLENYAANSFIIEGINRAIGISVFTILLMGLVSTIKDSGIIQTLIDLISKKTLSQAQGERWIGASILSAVLLTTHSVVAILMVSDLSNETGEKVGISSVRRANILSLMGCTIPFLLPYFIPVILMSSMTSSGEDFGISNVGIWQVGIHNFLSWALLLITFLVIFFGLGRKQDNLISEKIKHDND